MSLIPPVITILLAVLTKRIIVSLLAGVWLGSALVTQNIPLSFVKASEYFVSSLSEPGNAYIVLFLFAFGALAESFKVSGGVKGFGQLADRYVKSPTGALMSVWLLTPVTFLDCCFHVISTGVIAKPLMDKVKGSNERLAFVITTTSSQLIVLIPLATTYVGYIVGVSGNALRQAGLTQSPYLLYLQSIPFNFYSIGMVLLALGVSIWDLRFGRLRFGGWGRGEEGVHSTDEAHEQCKFEERVSPRAYNLLIPLLTLIALMMLSLWYTGRGGGSSFLEALVNADFGKATFIATLSTVILTAIFYAVQRVPFAEIDAHLLSGGTELLPPIVILVLSWSLSSVTKDLGFTELVTSVLSASIPKVLIPAIVFLAGGVTSYFIGSSWATWALIMPIGMTLAAKTGASVVLTMGAVLAGGSIGDNASPLGETPILTAAVTEVPLMKHIESTLPYALIVFGLSLVLYVLVSVLW